MSEPTITVGDKTYTVAEVTNQMFEKELTAALITADGVKRTLKRAIAASSRNADLLEQLGVGGAFRIAFKKKGETDWTRVRVVNGDLLQVAAQEEVMMRQEASMKNLAALLDVTTISINNI
jgi:hypothetical protein